MDNKDKLNGMFDKGRDFFDNLGGNKFIKAFNRGSPGANPAGMRQRVAEARFDAITDHFFGPAAGTAAKLAIGGAFLGGSKFLIENSNAINPSHPNAGLILGSGIMGGTIGNMVGGAVGRFLTESTENKLGSFAIKASARGLGGLAGGTIGTAIGVGMAYGPGYGVAALGAGAALAGGGVLAAKLLGSRLSSYLGMAGGINAAQVAAHSVGKIAGALSDSFLNAEYLARTVFTGGAPKFLGGQGVNGSMLDAWFPFFRNTPISKVATAAEAEAAGVAVGKLSIDPMKFAPNPRIVRRAFGIGALFAVGSAISEAMKPNVAPPTLFFDGVDMRHVNDMGTGGDYGRSMLGRNSSLNVNYQDMYRSAMLAL